MKDEFITKVKVVFRRFQGEIIALFPEEFGTVDPVTCCSYASLGQHCSADYYMVLTNSVAATDKEAEALKAELESIGYQLELFKGSPKQAYDIRKAKIVEFYRS